MQSSGQELGEATKPAGAPSAPDCFPLPPLPPPPAVCPAKRRQKPSHLRLRAERSRAGLHALPTEPRSRGPGRSGQRCLPGAAGRRRPPAALRPAPRGRTEQPAVGGEGRRRQAGSDESPPRPRASPGPRPGAPFPQPTGTVPPGRALPLSRAASAPGGPAAPSGDSAPHLAVPHRA